MLGVNDLVWVPDPEKSFVACKVVKPPVQGDGGKGLVEIVDSADERCGQQLEVDGGLGMFKMDEQSKQPIENMVNLKELNEASILHNLRIRFSKDDIYTNVGNILVAVNPFKLLPLYTPEVIDKYRRLGAKQCKPHVFAVADNAFSAMVTQNTNQSCIISGESGAGKTETTKLFLQYLTEVSSNNNNTAALQTNKNGKNDTRKNSEEERDSFRMKGGLQEEILQANPLMEAFGNAKTVRNNNSSRFGKWIQINFDPLQSSMKGGKITSYLLEKSRLVHQSEGERNYHIFYQLCAGARADKSLREALELGEAEEYHYLNQSGVLTVEGMNDESNWETVQRAMNIMHITATETQQCFEVLAGILHLGNIEFDQVENSGDGQAHIANPGVLALCARQLGVEMHTLERVLTSKNMGVRSVIQKPYTREEAIHARDALAKAIYAQLFDWLISKINYCLQHDTEDEAKSDEDIDSANHSVRSIGVLDIFGFESFKINSFEQLCINYCNEKLQLHFNEYIFKLEQEEYRKEGLNIDAIAFADNQPCVDALESKATGVFAMIDEEITIPKGSDTGFLSKVLQKASTLPDILKRPSVKEIGADKCFIVSHYAGPVSYNVTGFLDKNKDALHADLLSCMLTSNQTLVEALFRDFGADTDVSARNTRGTRTSSRNRASKTLGSKFKEQLQVLMSTLSETQPHFIRCVKPNSQKTGDLFESPMVLAQLRYAGLLEVCRIRQVGFPVRLEFPLAIRRYGCISKDFCPSGDPPQDAKMLCAALSIRGILQDDQWQLGTRKLFMKNAQHVSLESQRDQALEAIANKLQASIRMLIARKLYLEWLEILQTLTAASNIASVQAALDASVDLPYGGKHLEQVKRAQSLLDRLYEELRVMALLKAAIGSLDATALHKALEAAAEISLQNATVEEAREALEKVQKAKALRIELDQAMAERSLETLVRLVEKAKVEFGLTVEEDNKLRQAEIMLERLQGERKWAQKLDQVLSSCKDPKPLGQVLDEMTNWGYSPDEKFEHGKRVYQILYTVQEAQTHRNYIKLRDALESPDLPAANRPECAIELLDQLKLEQDVKDAMASDKLDSIQLALASLPSTAPQQLREEAETKLRTLQVIQELDYACSLNDVDKLQGVVTLASDLKLKRDDVPALDKAYKLLESAGEDSRFFSEISASVAAKDCNKLRELANEAQSKGKHDLAKRALEEVDRIKDELALVRKLATARTFEQVSDICKASRSDLAPTALDCARRAEKALGETHEDISVLSSIQESLQQAHLPAMVERVKDAKGRLEERLRLEEQLKIAMSSNDQNQMNSLLGEIEATFVEGSVAENHPGSPLLSHRRVESKVVESCRSMLHRGAKLGELTLALDEAMEEEDLDKLNDAMAQIIEAGITLDQETHARVKSMTRDLEVQREECASILGEMRILKSKASSAKGLQATDLAPLQFALESFGQDKDIAEVRQAKQLLMKAETQLLVQEELSLALKVCKYKHLKRAHEMTLENELEHLELASQVRNQLREKDRQRRAAQRAAHEAGVPFQDKEEEEEEKGGAQDIEESKLSSAEDGARRGSLTSEVGEEQAEQERLTLERRDRARNIRFDFTRYDKIRSDDNFAKGTFLLLKSRAKKDKLIYHSYVINKSMLDFGADKQLNKLAVGIHKSILGYCGDKSMAFPATLARDILSKGLDFPELVDEIYVQLCKQLTLNPRAESVGKAWQLMCMAVGTFPPSHDFELYLVNFLLRHIDIPGLIGNYAMFALRRLEGMMYTGSSGFLPSIEEIQAYNDRPPILAKIELVDGTTLTEELPITPDLDVGKVNEICIHFLGLADHRADQFGITLDGKIPLRKNDFMGDEFVHATREGVLVRFVFQRVIVLKMPGRDEPSDDLMFNRLVYLQAQAEFVQGRFDEELSEDEVLELIAESLAVDHGEDLPMDLVEDCGLAGYVPPSPCCQDLRSVAERASALYHELDLGKADPSELQETFVSKVQTKSHYGRLVFPTEDRGVLEIDSTGIHFEDQSFPFPALYRWGGSAKTFTVVVWNPETQDDKREETFRTSFGPHIGGVLLEMINHIMNTVNDDDESDDEDDESESDPEDGQVAEQDSDAESKQF